MGRKKKTAEEKDPRLSLFRAAKCRAKKKGLPFTITLDDIKFPKYRYCPVLGIRMDKCNKRGGQPQSPSLDRLIPELGYTPENIWVISLQANNIKSNACAYDIGRVAQIVQDKIAEVQKAREVSYD